MVDALSGLSIIPLGGLGEIGMNLMVYRYADEILVVDAGVTFPDDPILGIDLIIPDLTYLKENAGLISGILLTHGHEDHIGAVPYVLSQVANLPVYATPLTRGFLLNKLAEHGLAEKADLRDLVPREIVKFRHFEVEPLRVTHSIVDGVAFAIRTPVGVVIHTGDFKIDATPVDGRLFDTARFSRYGDEGVLVLLSDSTNVEREGHTPSERTVGPVLESIVARTRGKVLMATFSSNIHRIQQAVNAAVKYGRRVVFVGRSLIANVDVAEQLGYLSVPAGVREDAGSLAALPAERVLAITTGSQGEATSALARIAVDDHKQIKLAPGDAVILSARTIPGNERSISRMIDHVMRRGAEVHYRDLDVHVSGHACQEELKLMLAMTRPRHFIPVHGEYRHLVRHAQLAGQMDIPAERIFVIEDGQVVEFGEDGTGRLSEDRVETGRTFIDGTRMEEIDAVVVRDRQHLAEDGIVFAVVSLSAQTGLAVRDPEVITRGLVHEDESEEMLAEARAAIAAVIAESTLEEKRDIELFRGKLRAALRRYFRKRLSRRPMILPVVIEL